MSASSSAPLSTAIKLAGHSIAVSQSSGALITNIILGGASVVQASSFADLDTAIMLQGVAAAVASASGALANANPVDPNSPRLTKVGSENRFAIVQPSLGRDFNVVSTRRFKA